MTLDGIFLVDKMNTFSEHPPLELSRPHIDGVGVRKYRFKEVYRKTETYAGLFPTHTYRANPKMIYFLRYDEVDEVKELRQRRIL